MKYIIILLFFVSCTKSQQDEPSFIVAKERTVAGDIYYGFSNSQITITVKTDSLSVKNYANVPVMYMQAGSFKHGAVSLSIDYYSNGIVSASYSGSISGRIEKTPVIYW